MYLCVLLIVVFVLSGFFVVFGFLKWLFVLIVFGFGVFVFL